MKELGIKHEVLVIISHAKVIISKNFNHQVQGVTNSFNLTWKLCNKTFVLVINLIKCCGNLLIVALP